MKAVVLGKYHYMLYFLVLAMQVWGFSTLFFFLVNSLAIDGQFSFFVVTAKNVDDG